MSSGGSVPGPFGAVVVPTRPSWWRRAGRALARVFSPKARRAYEGAGRGRRFLGWTPSNTSANTELFQSLEMLRARARDMERNEPFAARAIETLAGNLVGGTGITARAATGRDQLDRNWTKWWGRWIKRCDITGVFGLNAAMKLAARALVRDGEVLIRRRILPRSSGLDVPLRIQVLEADFLDFWRNENRPDGSRTMHGVQFGASGEIEGYWIFREHPGATPGFQSIATFGVRPSEFVPAEEVIHLFVPERPGQVRGVPSLAVVMASLRDLGDYKNSVRLRKKLEACVMGFITPEDRADEDPETDPQMAPGVPNARVVNADGATVEDFQPGMMVTLKGGKSITFHSATPTPGEVDYEKQELRAIAAALGMSYELLTGDFSLTNYSSYKGAQIDFRRKIEGIQWEVLIPLGLDRIAEWFSEVAWAVSKIPTPEVNVEWNTARWQSVEPLKDAEAAEKYAALGFIPVPDIIGELGYHPETAMQTNADFFDKCKALGLPYQWIPTAATAPDGAASDAAGGDVQKTALNGAQVDALKGLLEAVAAGQLPAESAKAVALAAFSVDAATVDAMFDPLADFKPTPSNVTPIAKADPPAETSAAA